jgi:Uma2 family endonuclease
MTATLQRPPRKRKTHFDPEFRFTVAQYQEMIRGGIFAPDDRVELLDGKVVNKVARNPPHDVTLGLTQKEIERICEPDWVARAQMAVVLGGKSQPEPDIAVVRAPLTSYFKQHPLAKDIEMIVEVADSSLLDDRRAKAPIYAGARIPWYWIVNVQEKIVEAYSDPKSGAAPAYRKHMDYKAGEKIPVVLDGNIVGRIEVAKLFPETAD